MIMRELATMSFLSLAPGFSPVNRTQIGTPAASAAFGGFSEAVKTASWSNALNTGMKPGANETRSATSPATFGRPTILL